MDGDFFARVYDIVARIPAGRVCSYGRIARMLGDPRAAQQDIHQRQKLCGPDIDSLFLHIYNPSRISPVSDFQTG